MTVMERSRSTNDSEKSVKQTNLKQLHKVEMVSRIELKDEDVVHPRSSPEEGVYGKAKKPEGKDEAGSEPHQDTRIGNPRLLAITESDYCRKRKK